MGCYMNISISKPESARRWNWHIQATITYVAREWAAPMIVWVTICAMALTVVCILLAPAE
jgi:hypothetical protein